MYKLGLKNSLYNYSLIRAQPTLRLYPTTALRVVPKCIYDAESY